ncbi:hypothetical protein ThimaDRAFT_1790 [Thiocapsa marina 5811]|uniref:Uncharacterized protein n=1 Tax=Thiocapsa marina 5811 TaxID=768671 RepID=F9UA38_9GAMM|nr:hypothetical protein ThimaDRAFT_1790 [Thiocapsa marina 5811]
MIAHAGIVESSRNARALGVAMQVTLTRGDSIRDGVQARRDFAPADGERQREAMNRDIRKGRGEVGQDA